MSGPLKALVPLLDRALGIVDVGCRWGFAETWDALDDDVWVVGFDPDEDECTRLRERYAGRPNILIVPQALAQRRGRRVVHLTTDPACSSFFPPSPHVLDQVPDLQVIAPVSTRNCQVTTLDCWARKDAKGPIDYIKLDVQGGELDVLHGAHAALRSALILDIEVEFNPIYQGQPLFSDVDIFARRHGFHLWRLSHLVHYTRNGSPSHRKIDDRHFCDSVPVDVVSPGGQLFWGHALYVAVDVVERSGSDWLRLLRAGIVACALRLPDLALHAWTGARSAAPDLAAGALGEALGSYRV
jgi:FkbM family methyltransferase